MRSATDAVGAWLALLQAAGRERAWVSLLREAGSAQQLLQLDDRHLIGAGVSAQAVTKLRDPDAAMLDQWRAWLAQPSCTLVPFGTASYPPLLAAIADPPLALWALGDQIELLLAPQLAIVGSRNATVGGRRTAEALAAYLSVHGLTITSGLAAGIDTASHEGALRGMGRTIAVLGCGIDQVFPTSNAALAKTIAAQGLLVSEYAPGTPPRAWRFPARNRVIAGLCTGTLVVEAGRRSGALITARLAAEYGREVFAVPGSIHNPLARGCHALIKQGAKLVEDAADILIELRLELELAGSPQEEQPGSPARPHATQAPTLLDDAGYAAVLETLGYEPTSIAQLAGASGLTTAELSSMLLILELEGFVEALPGGQYCRLPARSR